MDELEELKRQKREIEKRIKELSPSYIRCGRATFKPYRYYGAKATVCQIAVKKSTVDNCWKDDKDHWKLYEKSYTIIEAKGKEETIRQLDEVIKDLTDLSNKLKGEQEC